MVRDDEAFFAVDDDSRADALTRHRGRCDRRVASFKEPPKERIVEQWLPLSAA